MQIDYLQAENFRNYSRIEAPFPGGLNLIFGENGAGKTSLIEAIELLSCGRSPRARADRELIRYHEHEALLHCTFTVGKDHERETRIDMGLHRTPPRIVKVNGSLQKGLADWVGRLKAVSFFQNDLSLISGEPAQRRRFLNTEISKGAPAYITDCLQYRRCLTQRNSLLREFPRTNDFHQQLEAWNDALTECGARIIRARARFVEQINAFAKEIYSSLTSQGEQIEVVYLSGSSNRSCESAEKTAGTEGTEGDARRQFRASLEKRREEELHRGVTLVGPHRDDIRFLLGLPQGSEREWLDLRRFGSQGQLRTGALAAKLSVARILREDTGEPPAVLLDDVFSELDRKRRRAVLGQLKNFDQLFITATDHDVLDISPEFRTSLYEVRSGNIIESSPGD